MAKELLPKGATAPETILSVVHLLQQTRGQIPRMEDGKTIGAISQLVLRRCRWKLHSDTGEVINIAFSEEHELAGGVVAFSHTENTTTILLKVDTKEISIDWSDGGSWMLNDFPPHHDAIHKLGLQGEQRELLMSSFNKKEFTHNKRTGQGLCFVSGDGLAVELTNDESPPSVTRIPFDFDAVYWHGADVYIYLKNDAASRTKALISFSRAPDAVYFKLDRFSLFNPQQRLASGLTKFHSDWHSAVYAKLFEGFDTESHGKFNFIISSSNVISLVHRTSTGICMQIDGLKTVGGSPTNGVLSLCLVTNAKQPVAVFLLLKEDDSTTTFSSIRYKKNLAFACDGNVIGLDQLYYH
eukprot:GHVS01004196.1.p1 GENE.GHVS01004196.1~~GHVS01004196.1.p1  ORF type:complete len:354 (+),score=31.73 GHVS01004196.1:343-1404(+)